MFLPTRHFNEQKRVVVVFAIKLLMTMFANAFDDDVATHSC